MTDETGYRIWIAAVDSGRPHGRPPIDYHVRGPLLRPNRLGVDPLIAPTHDGISWGDRTVTATYCRFGCSTFPGRCGRCGLYFVRDFEDFGVFFDVHKSIHFPRGDVSDRGSLRQTIVAGRIKAHGPIAVKTVGAGKLPEHRASAVTIQNLCVLSTAKHWVDGLHKRYRVPVYTGINYDNLTRKWSA